MPKVTIVSGDLLEQDVEVIVNPWNRNVFPWWLLVPHGVSGAIRKKAGTEPFRELRKHGVLPLGGVVTGAGRRPYKAIIHVAGIGFLWTSSEEAVRRSVRSAIRITIDEGFKSIAFPLIGAGTGGMPAARVEKTMVDEIGKSRYEGHVRIVRYG
jgi:O-acetyl-ADP-ribose deacetylase (regulator of RNase III)